jgi:hypothetical protein
LFIIHPSVSLCTHTPAGFSLRSGDWASTVDHWIPDP